MFNLFFYKFKNLDLKVKKFCLKNLSIFQIPRHYIFTNEIPKNKLGKPDRVKLDKLIEDYKKL